MSDLQEEVVSTIPIMPSAATLPHHRSGQLGVGEIRDLRRSTRSTKIPTSRKTTTIERFARVCSPLGSIAATLPRAPAPPDRWERSSSPGLCTRTAGISRRASHSLGVLILIAPAIWAAGRHAQDTGSKDPQIVVVDEVVGQWITLAGASDSTGRAGCRVRAVPTVRYLEAAARAPTGATARRRRHRSGRCDGRHLRRACVVRALDGSICISIASFMAFRKNPESRPQISDVSPAGGDPRRRVPDPRQRTWPARTRPRSRFGELSAPIVIGSDSYVIVRVPEGALARRAGGRQGRQHHRLDLRHRHSDRRGHASRLESRRRQLRQHLHHLQRIARPEDAGVDLQDRHQSHAEATRHRHDERHRPGARRRGVLYCSSRHDGIVYQVSPAGNTSMYVEGMGVATGIVFDQRRKSLRRRPQRNHFQDQPAAPDLRLRHARTVHRRVSSGLRPRRISLRHRSHHIELRCVHRIRPTGKWRRFIAGWAVRRAWRSMRKEICT